MPIDRQARIIKKKSWGSYYLFKIESPEIAGQAEPGQFLMIKVSSQPQPLLRRPISLHNAEKGTVEIFFQVAGTGTRLLAEKEAGSTMDLLGPLGRGFRVEEKLKGQEVFCVGGGRGIAPLYFLARKLKKAGAKPVVFYGGRTKEDLPLTGKLKELGLEVLFSTDDGSAGFPGLVTALVRETLATRSPAFLYACGPEAMMENLAQLCQQKNLPAEFSLESIMGCGFGACFGCVRKIRRNGQPSYLKICQEGPVFGLEEIVWQEKENG